MLARINDCRVEDNSLFIQSIYGQKSSYIFRFDLNGKFLNTIGAVGRGPGEYPVSAISVDTDKKRIIVFRWYGKKDYISFDYNGNYIEKLPYPKDQTMQFDILKDGKVVVQPYGSIMEDYKSFDKNLKLYTLYDTTGKVLDSIPHPFLKGAEDIEGKYISGQYGFNDISYFKYEARLSGQNQDTAYMTIDDKIEPAFIFNRANLSPDFDQRYLLSPDNTHFLSSWFKIYETAKYVFRQYNLEDVAYLFRLNKSTGVVTSMKFNSTAKRHNLHYFDNFGFVDDISGGHNIYPFRTNNEGNLWISWYDATSFKEAFAKDGEPYTFGSDTSAINQRLKVVDKLKADHNPVIVLIYLKKK